MQQTSTSVTLKEFLYRLGRLVIKFMNNFAQHFMTFLKVNEQQNLMYDEQFAKS